MWSECVKVDIRKLGLIREYALIRDRWKRLTSANNSTLP